MSLIIALLLVPLSNGAILSQSDSPETWKEHWFEHDQLLSRVYQDNDVAVYFDRDMDRSIKWMNGYMSKVWKYTKSVYGQFGNESQLYAIFHSGKYSGGHPSTFMDSSHDFRNTIDVGSSSKDAWKTGKGNDLDIVTHEVAHIVEGASKDRQGSPAFDIWKDSKWAEIFILDVYASLNMKEDYQRWYNSMIKNSDNFPRANSYWFRDWFYPIYKNYGATGVLNRFFSLLARDWPTFQNKAGKKQYSRGMNHGEFFHFWSGAANKNLKDLATKAFGWTQEYEDQFTKAQKDFSKIVYKK